MCAWSSSPGPSLGVAFIPTHVSFRSSVDNQTQGFSLDVIYKTVFVSRLQFVKRFCPSGTFSSPILTEVNRATAPQRFANVGVRWST